MKIAIVGPSPVPFMIGGVESLLQGLLHSINTLTPHQADLIKLPSRELKFWDLVETYRAFHRLDLGHFDCVIATKYPAWAVKHPQKIVYMQHRLRGLYDTYDERLETPWQSWAPEVVQILEGKEEADFPDRLFEALDALREQQHRFQGQEWDQLTAFPGSFIRAVVRALDHWALAPKRVTRFLAISETVRRRKDYFPPGVDVEVVHHPPYPLGYRCGEGRYFFTASRLDGPKRIKLIVEALRRSRSNVGLKIAGEGPERLALEQAAGGDPRVELLGFVEPETLKELYAGALAVLYTPMDEDLGLVTLEAMLSGKPVVTCSDSGGPTEFIRDGECGFVVSPGVEALSSKIEFLAEQPQQAVVMGRKGMERAAEVTWDRVCARLTGTPPRRQTLARRPRMVVFCTYPIYPPRGGGQNRIFHLYRALSSQVEIEVVSLVDSYFAPQKLDVGPHYRLTSFAMDPAAIRELRNEEARVGRGLYDIFVSEAYPRTPAFLEYAQRAAERADMIVISHPYLAPLASQFRGKTCIYDAHNTEAPMKESYFGAEAREWSRKVAEIESLACSLSSMIWVTSPEEGQALDRLYGTSSKAWVVPNGVDEETIHFVDSATRQRAKARFEVNGAVALFVGSYHPPNIEAVEWIVQHFQSEDFSTFVLGSVANHFGATNRFGSVWLTGEIAEAEKLEFYKLADVGLNPMVTGGGTNLKLIEYLCAGLPAVTTDVGMRGLAPVAEWLTVCPLSDFGARIRELLHLPPSEERRSLSSAAASKTYGWGGIGRRLLAEMAFRRMVAL